MKSAGQGLDIAQLLAWIEDLSEEKTALTQSLRDSKREVEYPEGDHRLNMRLHGIQERELVEKCSNLEGYVARADEACLAKDEELKNGLRKHRNESNKRIAELEIHNDSILRENYELSNEKEVLVREKDALTRKLEVAIRESERLGREVEALRLKPSFLEENRLLAERERLNSAAEEIPAFDPECGGREYCQEGCEETDTNVPDTRSASMLPTLAEELRFLIDDQSTESGSELEWCYYGDVTSGLERTRSSATPPSIRNKTDAVNESPVSPKSNAPSISTQQSICSGRSPQASFQNASAGTALPSCLPAQQAEIGGKSVDTAPRYSTALHDCDWVAAPASSVDLNSLNGHADQGKLLTIAAIVHKHLKRDRRTDQYLLIDDGRCGMTSVRAVLSRSSKSRFPRARTGDGVILRHVHARYNSVQIPYISSVKESTWCIWTADSKSACLQPGCCKSRSDRRRMQELSAWWRG